MIQYFTVKKTVDLDLCISCGICKVVCPCDAIALEFSQGQYIPVISDICNECGYCLKTCPGYQVNFRAIYNNENRELPEDVYLGHVIESFICYTKDEDIIKKAASGGMITSLITELLNQKIYKGAFVLPFEAFDTGLARVQFTMNVDQVLAASKSKYFPASVDNVVSMLGQIVSPIIVGTSCQIHGIKKYCMENNIDYSSVLFLGLFCEKTLNYNLLTYYQWKFGEGKKITHFNYRNKEKEGWPGHTKMTFEGGEDLFVDRSVRMRLKEYFQLKRCLFCIDKLNQLADISFGDCYIKGEETELGKSNILIRTKKGKKAIEAVKDKLVLKNVGPSVIASSQRIEKKRQNLHYCHLLERKHGHAIYPDIQQKVKLDKGLNIIEKEYQDFLKLIDLGRDTSKFTQIDSMIRKNKMKKAVKKLAGMIARKAGVKK